MKKPILGLLCLLVLSSLACTISINNSSAVKVGETQTLTIQEPAASGSDPARITLTMGAGKLNITGGSENLVEGTVRYNVEDWKPVVTRDGDELSISQLDQLKNGIPAQNITNEWDLTLGTRPMSLKIKAGAYDGTLDLSDIPLTHLEVSDGASNAVVHFNVPNPVQMDELSYKTGASNVELAGLANANFERMEFAGGAGNYTLDFSGTLQRDASVTITGGVSETRIIIPKGMKSVIDFKGGLANINTRGTWTVTDNHYESSGDGPTLTINVTVGAGNVDLRQE
jgi:hypothetical protein